MVDPGRWIENEDELRDALEAQASVLPAPEWFMASTLNASIVAAWKKRAIKVFVQDGRLMIADGRR